LLVVVAAADILGLFDAPPSAAAWRFIVLMPLHSKM